MRNGSRRREPPVSPEGGGPWDYQLNHIIGDSPIFSRPAPPVGVVPISSRSNILGINPSSAGLARARAVLGRAGLSRPAGPGCPGQFLNLNLCFKSEFVRGFTLLKEE